MGRDYSIGKDALARDQVASKGTVSASNSEFLALNGASAVAARTVRSREVPTITQRKRQSITTEINDNSNINNFSEDYSLKVQKLQKSYEL